MATVTGEVAAGAIVSHRVPYGTQGSQNNGNVAWSGQFNPGGPRLRFYATRLGCEDFNPSNIPDFGACATLSRAGWFEGQIASTLLVTNGRGNPDVLGTPAEYTIWVVGDPDQRATYSVNITYFFGPDC